MSVLLLKAIFKGATQRRLLETVDGVALPVDDLIRFVDDVSEVGGIVSAGGQLHALWTDYVGDIFGFVWGFWEIVGGDLSVC